MVEMSVFDVSGQTDSDSNNKIFILITFFCIHFFSSCQPFSHILVSKSTQLRFHQDRREKMDEIIIEDCGSLPQLTRVEMPCFMKDTAKVLEALGGQDIVMESLLGDANFLHANLTPHENPPRYSFKATPVTSNGFLVKIRRKKKRVPGDTEAQPTVKIVGHVAKSYIFDRPVGCQVWYDIASIYFSCVCSLCSTPWLLVLAIRLLITS